VLPIVVTTGSDKLPDTWAINCKAESLPASESASKARISSCMVMPVVLCVVEVPLTEVVLRRVCVDDTVDATADVSVDDTVDDTVSEVLLNGAVSVRLVSL
jgi:hypothetical protein